MREDRLDGSSAKGAEHLLVRKHSGEIKVDASWRREERRGSGQQLQQQLLFRPSRSLTSKRAGTASALYRQALEQDIAWLLDYLFATVLDGRNASLTDGVQRALGRAPPDFADLCTAATASGVWNPPS